MMQGPCHVSDIDVVVVQGSSFEKSALGRGDHPSDHRRQTPGEHFRKEFGQGVDQADRPEVADTRRSCSLGKQTDKGAVERGEITTGEIE
jgi:hypothetical protein